MIDLSSLTVEEKAQLALELREAEQEAAEQELAKTRQETADRVAANRLAHVEQRLRKLRPIRARLHQERNRVESRLAELAESEPENRWQEDRAHMEREDLKRKLQEIDRGSAAYQDGGIGHNLGPGLIRVLAWCEELEEEASKLRRTS